jgi:hypothetical protein
MTAANASARGERSAILASRLHELTEFCLAVDCLARVCGGERSFAVSQLASFYGRDRTVGDVLRRMRYSGAWGGRVARYRTDAEHAAPTAVSVDFGGGRGSNTSQKAQGGLTQPQHGHLCHANRQLQGSPLYN